MPGCVGPSGAFLDTGSSRVDNIFHVFGRPRSQELVDFAIVGTVVLFTLGFLLSFLLG